MSIFMHVDREDDEKIRVPEGMLMAALRAQYESCASDPMQVVGRGLQAALGWLLDNMPKRFPGGKGTYQWQVDQVQGYNAAIEKLRRMFQEEDSE